MKSRSFSKYLTHYHKNHTHMKLLLVQMFCIYLTETYQIEEAADFLELYQSLCKKEV